MAKDGKGLLTELTILGFFIAWWFIFVQTNVSPVLGSVYIGMTFAGFAVVLIDYLFGEKQVQLINPKNPWISVILGGVLGYIILIFGGRLIISLAENIPLSEALKLLGTAAPVFSRSAILNFITFAVVIAYIETYALFIGGFDLLASWLKVDIDRKNLASPKLWLVIFGIAVLFLLLHVNAKGIENQKIILM